MAGVRAGTSSLRTRPARPARAGCAGPPDARYVVSGELHVEHEDGTTGDVAAGDMYRIAPGHDAWVLGDEAAVFVEFRGAAHYAES